MESSEQKRNPAGGGKAAVAYLNESGNSKGSTDVVPKPPSSQPSGRPQPRRDNNVTDPEEEEIWRTALQGVLSSSEASQRCVALGAQLQRGALELIAVGRAEGANEAELKRIVCENIFRPCPNPQDGARVESVVAADEDKQKKGRVQMVLPANEEDTPKARNGEQYRSVKSFSSEEIGEDGVKRRYSDKTKAGLQQRDLRTATVVKDLFASKHVEGHPSLIYDLGTQVGQGTFGTVRKARHRQTHQIHAIKAVKKEAIDQAELWAEINIMKQLDHPHIMRLYYTFEDEECIYMASEMCLGGELYDTIDEAGFFTERIAAFLFVQIVGSVNYLHLKSICHRDLKPENFLVLNRVEQDQLQLKLIDFGTAKRFDLKPMVTKVCTAHYVAPEVLKRGEVPYTEKVDIWSCGVILYMMLCGFMPFHHDSQTELLKLVKKGKFEYKPDKVWKLISQPAKDLISSMMCVKVENRLAASEVLHHPWTISTGDDARHQEHMDEQIVRQMRKFLTNNRLKRVALQIIARQITDESIQRLRDIFQDIDADSSGCLTLDEMKEALKNLDVSEASQQEMAHILACVDQDQSGTIEWTEFLAATLTKEQYLQEETMKGAFYVLDVDEDGVLSATDLTSLMGLKSDRVEGLLSYSSLLEIEGIMKECDANGDGDISFEEFCTLMADDGPRAVDTAVSLRYRRGRRERYSVLTDEQLQRNKTEALSVLSTQFSMNADMDEDTIDGDHERDAVDDFGDEDEHFLVKAASSDDHAEWRMQTQKAWELNDKPCTLTIYEKKDEGLLQFEIVYLGSGERMTATGSQAEFDTLCEEQAAATGPAKIDAAIRHLFDA